MKHKRKDRKGYSFVANAKGDVRETRVWGNPSGYQAGDIVIAKARKKVTVGELRAALETVLRFLERR